MPAPTIDKLRAYLPLKTLTADGQALPTHTATASSTSVVLDATTLFQSDNYWTGAVGWFKGDTTTAALRGVFFHVKTSTGNKITLAKNLPAVPATGDTFQVILGGNWRSTQEAFGLLVGGKLPELETVAGVNITGLTVRKASPMLGAVTLTVRYDFAADTLAAKIGAGAYGTPVSAAADLTDVPLFVESDAAWVRVSTVAASLPGATQTDTWSLTQPKGTFTPDYEGYETVDGGGGKVRYRLEVVKNVDPLNTMVDPRVYSDKPSGAATTIAGGQSLGTGAGDVGVTDASTWPAAGFWVLNTTKNDCRYILSRSGNTLSAAAANDWVTLGWSAGSGSSPQRGSTLTMANPPSASCVIVDFPSSNTLLGKLSTAGWATGAANHGGGWITVTTVSYGLRGFAAVAWAAADAIELMSDVDLASVTPNQVTPQFSSPSTESIQPTSDSGFLHAASQAASLSINTGLELRPNDLAGVWRREWIVDDHQARADISTDTIYSWS